MALRKTPVLARSEAVKDQFIHIQRGLRYLAMKRILAALKNNRRMMLLVFLALTLPKTAPGQQIGSPVEEAESMLQLNLVELEDQLVNGLRAVTGEQRAFLRTVVKAVEDRRIPRSMVNVLFVWSRERNPKYPFPYFRLAITTLADRRGVNL
ncbi:MAG: hypothetical protein ACKN94_07960 [Pirellulaceae bacterium]